MKKVLLTSYCYFWNWLWATNYVPTNRNVMLTQRVPHNNKNLNCDQNDEGIPVTSTIFFSVHCQYCAPLHPQEKVTNFSLLHRCFNPHRYHKQCIIKLTKCNSYFFFLIILITCFPNFRLNTAPHHQLHWS